MWSGCHAVTLDYFAVYQITSVVHNTLALTGCTGDRCIIPGTAKCLKNHSKTLQVQCNKAGRAKDSTDVISVPGPAHLRWGEVLVSMQYAPMNPADIYTITTGGTYGDDQAQPPFLCGHDGIGIVSKASFMHSSWQGYLRCGKCRHLTWLRFHWFQFRKQLVVRSLMICDRQAFVRECSYGPYNRKSNLTDHMSSIGNCISLDHSDIEETLVAIPDNLVMDL